MPRKEFLALSKLKKSNNSKTIQCTTRKSRKYIMCEFPTTMLHRLIKPQSIKYFAEKNRCHVNKFQRLLSVYLQMHFTLKTPSLSVSMTKFHNVIGYITGTLIHFWTLFQIIKLMGNNFLIQYSISSYQHQQILRISIQFPSPKRTICWRLEKF